MNTVTLAVAGARKTQSIVDACSSAEPKRRLVLTFTLSGQQDIERRLRKACEPALMPDVMGWYAFLMRHWVKPFLPLKYPGRRLTGLNFDGEPAKNRQGVVIASGDKRFLDAESRVYKRFLSKLAIDVATAANGTVISRLERMYDEIYVDEIQDLTGYDLDVVELLLQSLSSIRLVGDLRQSVFDTNPQDPKHPEYRGLKMLDWFKLQESKGRLAIDYSSTTYRSNQEIALFSDTIFRLDLGFPPTISASSAKDDHSGVFTVAWENVDEYIRQYKPACLRQLKTSPTPESVVARNFGICKGLTYDRVLIITTGPIKKFLEDGTLLSDKSACGLYVGVTRAIHSVAFVSKTPHQIVLPEWHPESSSAWLVE